MWRSPCASWLLCAVFCATVSPAFACNESLLKIAESIDHPATYSRIAEGHCEGRYGGLFSSGSDQFAMVLGFEREVNDELLSAEDHIRIKWPAKIANPDSITGVYLRPKFYFRMDAQPSKSGEHNWQIARLASILRQPVPRSLIAVTVSKLSESGDRVWLPVKASTNENQTKYRIVFESLARIDSLNWNIVRRDSANNVILEETLTNITRNEFIELSVPMAALGEEGEFLVKLSATLRNGAILQQDVVFLHTLL